jgi:hypothetical protein
LRPAAQLAPQQRADLVADQPIQHAPRLLRVHAVKVNRARALQGALHGGGGDFVELDALGVLQSERLLDVPCDCLALAVGVGRQVHHRRALRHGVQALQRLFAVGQRRVGRLEVVVDIHPQLGLRQVAHMPHRRLNRVGVAENFGERARLGGRFHDNHGLARRRGQRAFRARGRALRALGSCGAGAFRHRSLPNQYGQAIYLIGCGRVK